jgi:hypothetical protein
VQPPVVVVVHRLEEQARVLAGPVVQVEPEPVLVLRLVPVVDEVVSHRVVAILVDRVADVGYVVATIVLEVRSGDQEPQSSGSVDPVPDVDRCPWINLQ